jgi:hypothetical protein
MATALQSVRVLGVHHVEPSTEQFNETVEVQWGDGLTGEKLKEAEESVREHYNGLYLIEVQIDPPDATVEWGDFAQRIVGKPQSDWQVAYDKRAIDASNGTWAFFLHYVDFSKPLETPLGPQQMPDPSSRPAHLSDCEYWVP